MRKNMNNSEKRRQSKINKRNLRIKNRKPNKLIQFIVSDVSTSSYGFDEKTSIPKTSEELCEMNEIKSDEDLYKNIYFLDWTYEGQVIWNEEKENHI